MQKRTGRENGGEEGASEGKVSEPASGGERVEIVDVLRGGAILGMLVANLEYFRTPEAWGGYGGTPSASTQAYLFLEAFLADGKFVTALSFLFGLGLAMQVRRSRDPGRAGTAFFIRRLLALAAIGATHALLVWSGDILLFYAALGVPFLLFVRLRPRVLVACACAILGVWPLAGLTLAVISFGGPEPASPSLALDGIARSAEAAYTSGSFREMTGQRVREYLANLPPALLTSFPQIFSMMLLGAATANAGWVGGGSFGGRARRAAVLGLAVGVPLNFFYALPAGAGNGWYYLKLTAWLFGAPIMALGWMGLVVFLQERFGLTSGRLAAVGRMALTNYLSQSLILTTVFYWFGFYGNSPIEFAVGLMIGVWVLQILWSRPYLSRFGYGPVEWLWRRLSYGRLRNGSPR